MTSKDQPTHAIKRIHFFVHPGYFYTKLDPDDFKGIEQSALGWKKESKELIGHVTDTLSLPSDEVIVVLPQLDRTTIRSEEYEEYLSLMKGVKEKYGRQCVVLFDPVFASLDDPKIFYPLLKRILRARGYSISESTIANVFGESFGCCVVDAAKMLRQQFGLSEVYVDVDKTDLRNMQKEARDLISLNQDTQYQGVNFIESSSTEGTKSRFWKWKG